MKMKKALVVLVMMVTLLTLCGCSGSNGSTTPESSESEVRTLADDTTMGRMVVTVPENYVELERYIEEDGNGKIIEKNLNYSFTEDSGISYACMPDQDLVEMLGSNLDKLEKIESNGNTIYTYISGSDCLALVQVGEDIYGLEYLLTEDQDAEVFNKAVSEMSFKDEKTELLKNDMDLYDISYELDPALNVYCMTSSYVEDPSGKPLEKTIIWKFGESDDNMDFRFMIRVYKDSTIDEVKDPDKTYEEQTVNGITYTALTNDDGAPYEYYTQHGNDVYEIRNNGSYSGWFTDRSEDSEKAFEAFLNTISFNQ